MPEREFITGIPGVKVRDVFEQSRQIEIEADALVHHSTACPKCQSQKYRIKASRIRTFKHAILGKKLVRLHVRIPKFL